MVGKHAPNTACDDALFKNELPSIVASGIEERHDLMISVLSSGIFAIADSNRSFFHIDVRPLYPANLSLPHCSRYGEPNDSSER